MAKWDVVKDSGFAKPQVVAKAVTAEQAAVKRQELRAKEKPGSSANYTVRKGKR